MMVAAGAAHTATAPSGNAMSADAIRAKLAMVQHAIAQLNDDIQTTRAKYASKQTEMEMLMQCVVGASQQRQTDPTTEGSTSVDSSTLVVRGQRKTVSFVHDGSVPLIRSATVGQQPDEDATTDGIRKAGMDAIGPLRTVHPAPSAAAFGPRRCANERAGSDSQTQRCLDVGAGGTCHYVADGLDILSGEMEQLRHKRSRPLELNIDGPLSPSRERARPSQQRNDAKSGSPPSEKLMKRPLRRLIGAPQKESTQRAVVLHSNEGSVDNASSLLNDSPSHADRPHRSTDSGAAPRLHLHHMGRITANTPLTSRNVNIDRSDAVGRKCGSGPSTFLNDMVAARRALARSSIVLAGGDTELLDL